MKVKITTQKRNPLLKRKEISFEVEHEKIRGTPSRSQIRAKVAEILKMKLEQVYVRKVETKTGTMTALGKANAYDTVEQAQRIEPKYIVERNAPKEEAKEPETQPKAEKPEKTAKPAEEPKAQKPAKPEEPKRSKEKEEHLDE